MKIYESKSEALARAREVIEEHPGAELSEGRISFCGIKDGQYIEKTYPTLQIGFESYNRQDGWIDHSVTIVYAK